MRARQFIGSLKEAGVRLWVGWPSWQRCGSDCVLACVGCLGRQVQGGCAAEPSVLVRCLCLCTHVHMLPHYRHRHVRLHARFRVCLLAAGATSRGDLLVAQKSAGELLGEMSLFSKSITRCECALPCCFPCPCMCCECTHCPTVFQVHHPMRVTVSAAASLPTILAGLRCHLVLVPCLPTPLSPIRTCTSLAMCSNLSTGNL